jgi:pimeloyl-ACP methyl ester carboxylesterase
MIHALPGMGADHRMFPHPWNRLPGFSAYDWPRHRGERKLSDVALRVCEEHRIADGDTVVGASLGGMIACEIAKIRKLNTVYLVGSAIRHDEVSRWLTVLLPLVDLAPIEWLRFSAGRIPADMAQMFATVEPSFVRCMCQAIFEWEGLGLAPVRYVRIHGRRDLVIPPPTHVDLLLDDGGHLISMTHAKQCAQFIEANHSSRSTAARRLSFDHSQ